MRVLTSLVAVLACAAPSFAQSAVTSYTFVSQADDYIGQGRSETVTLADGSFTATKNFDNGVSIDFQGPQSSDFWWLDFAAPMSVPLTPGAYPHATRFPFQDAAVPGLSVSGEHRGCNTLTGEFTVIDIVYGSGDTIVSFAADFEQHCEGGAAALFGSIRYNYVPPPFTVTPASAGIGAGAQVLQVSVVASPPSGQWTASTGDSWLSVPATGGGGLVNIGVARNTSAAPRTGTLMLGGQTVIVTQRANGVPGTPGRPSAVVTAGQGHFAWIPSDTTGGDATTYHVEVGVSPGGTALSFDTSTPSFDVSGVPGGHYYLRVRGSNEWGTGPASGELAIVVSPSGDTLPDAPQSLGVTLAQSQATIGWTPPVSGGALGYRLEIGSWSGASDRGVVRTSTTSVGPVVVPSGVYFVRVRAENAAGIGPPSNEVLLRVGALTAPPGPPSLSGSVSGSNVALTWIASTVGDQALRYRVEAGVEAGVPTLAYDTTSPATALTFPNVPPGQYYVRVRGINSRGVGPASNEIRVVVP